MKTLPQYIKNSLKSEMDKIQFEKALCKDVIVDAIIIDDATYNSIKQNDIVVEAKTIYPQIPGTKYTYRIDIPYGEQKAGNMKHIHIYCKHGELFAMNVDATAHDGWHNVLIPNRIIPFLKSKGFKIPENNIIEFYSYSGSNNLLLESQQMMDNDVAITAIALKLGEIIRKANRFQFVESNVTSTDILVNKHVFDKYDHIETIGINNHIVGYTIIRDSIINASEDFDTFDKELISIFDDKFAPRQLYIVWKE